MAVISGLLVAAHYVRDGLLILAVVGLMLPWFLVLNERWVTRAVQVFLVLAAFDWGYTMYALIEERQAAGDPWMRMAAILSGVMLFTLLSAIAAGKLKPPPVQ